MSARKTGPLYRSTAAVMVLLLLSKVLGFLRQAVIAGVLGANSATDLYFIPSEFLTNISGAISQALITALVTVYVSVRTRQGRKEAEVLASRAVTLVTLGSGCLAIVLLLLSGPLSHVLAPGYQGADLARLTGYLRLLSFEVLLTGAQAGLIAVLNAENRFTPGRLYGLLFNPLAILAVLLFGRQIGIGVLVPAVYLAQGLLLVILALCTRREMRFRLQGALVDPEIRQFLLLALPVCLCNVIMQGNLIGGKAICSTLGESIASSFSYAYSLEQLVTGTFTAALTVTVFPRLAELAAREDRPALSGFLRTVLTIGASVLLLVTVLAVISARDVVAIVYERGAFTSDNARTTALALCGFSLGFPLVMARELLRQVHFVFQRAKSTMIVDLCAVGVCLLLALGLSRPFGVLGVAAAVSLGALFAVIVLSVSALRRLSLPGFAPDLADSGKALLALALSGIVCFLVRQIAGSPLPRLLLGVLAGLLVYAAALLVLRPRVLTEALGPVLARFKK